MTTLAALVLSAAAFDGDAALRHAAALAALGPRPWGSPRARAAAQYVAAQFRGAGLAEVRTEEFESHGVIGVNAIGVLRSAGPEYVVVGAHHDTAPDAPGAYDDGGGVGVLIEAARVLARSRDRPRTLVFVSWDGEEAWSTGLTTTAGSRAFLKTLGPDARDLAAAVAIEMCGWKRGTPVLHPIAYADPVARGPYTIAPAWLVRAARAGARQAGAPLGVGDPWIGWLYQPAVRTFRVGLYGDDLSFLQSGHPAVFVSDSSFSAFYPWYHTADDTADKLDPAALSRMGAAVLGVAEALGRAPRGPASQPHWFAGPFGVWERGALLAAGGLGLLAPLVRRRDGGARLAARLVALGLGAAVLWRHPVPSAWCLLLPGLAAAFGAARIVRGLALAPALALAALGGVAWVRGFVRGLWLAPWEVAALGAALALLFVAGGPGGAGAVRGPREAGRRLSGGRRAVRAG